ncbi:MAG: MscL family protein [Bacilli bacterium]|nr:MscL family protein [Bacilli bacterium]
MCKKKDPNKKGFFGEFKDFITRGNVLDMAVGVIIGGAFTAIVTALTSGILQPIINYIIGKIVGDGSLEAARTVLDCYVLDDGTKWWPSMGQIPADRYVDWAATNYIDWGNFISAIINFLLVALILFLIIRTINRVHKVGEEAKKKLEEKAKSEEEKKDE